MRDADQTHNSLLHRFIAKSKQIRFPKGSVHIVGITEAFIIAPRSPLNVPSTIWVAYPDQACLDRKRAFVGLKMLPGFIEPEKSDPAFKC